MIGLLDPALLLPRNYVDWMGEFQREITDIVRSCINYNVRIVAFEEYWQYLWLRLGQPLESLLSPEARRTLYALRALREEGPHVNLPIEGTVWRRGFRQLFGAHAVGHDLETLMATAAAQAVQLDEDVIIFTRRIEGRNLITHRAGNSTLHENTRWILHIRLKNFGHRTIRCIYNSRNLAERWSTRYDWRLPSEADGSRYPFCPLTEWWKPSVDVFSTISSKTAWVDNHSNGWSRPNIPQGAGYHWDVYLRNIHHAAAIGVQQLNIVEFGAPLSEGQVGHIHHIPAALRGRVNDAGWTC